MTMLQKLYSPQDIAERYACSLCTARRYIRQMRHMEDPLRVFESDLKAWETKRTVESPDVIRQRILQEKMSRRKFQAGA